MPYDQTCHYSYSAVTNVFCDTSDVGITPGPVTELIFEEKKNTFC